MPCAFSIIRTNSTKPFHSFFNNISQIASSLKGSRFACDTNPLIGSKGQRYVGLRYISVGTTTAGSVFGDIGTDIQDGQKYYANGFAVL
jgi:hypothetical protein